MLARAEAILVKRDGPVSALQHLPHSAIQASQELTNLQIGAHYPRLLVLTP
jgi:hypothetical protein